MPAKIRNIRVIDSHTEGEPTRVVIGGFPDLGGGSVKAKLDIFKSRFDHFRSAIVREPRGHEAVVGAIVCPSERADCSAGVIFFNNVGFLNMCGHGTIGLIRTLEYTGAVKPGKHRIETPVGVVEADLEKNGFVEIENVPSYRFAKDVKLKTEHFGPVTGDIAWGGNWFFLTGNKSFLLNLENLQTLREFALDIKKSLHKENIRGGNGAEIDHIEIFSESETADSKNFVLCPGGEFDRSPCGTGTSAKLACLFEDGKLKEGEIWVQESIIGSRFEGRVRLSGGKIIPTIRGRAFITGVSELIFDENDPFCFGIN